MELCIYITGAHSTSYAGWLRTRLSTLRFNPSKKNSLFSAFFCPKDRKDGVK